MNKSKRVKPSGFKSRAACLPVGFGIIIRYQWKSDDAVVLPSHFRYQAKIINNKVIAPPRVVAINFGIHILDINNQGIDNPSNASMLVVGTLSDVSRLICHPWPQSSRNSRMKSGCIPGSPPPKVTPPFVAGNTARQCVFRRTIPPENTRENGCCRQAIAD